MDREQGGRKRKRYVCEREREDKEGERKKSRKEMVRNIGKYCQSEEHGKREKERK